MNSACSERPEPVQESNPVSIIAKLTLARALLIIVKMPLQEAEPPADFTSLKTGQNHFLIFFSSRVDGKMWCPDCVAVEQLVNETFAAESSPPAAIVYVGQKAEWKSQDNAFRKDPWHLTAIPTIVRLNDAGEEISRLVEDDFLDPTKFSSFVQPRDTA